MSQFTVTSRTPGATTGAIPTLPIVQRAWGRCRPDEDRHYHGSGLTCDCGASPSVQPAAA